MTSNPSNPSPPTSGGLQAMLARLRGLVQARKPDEQPDDEQAPDRAEAPPDPADQAPADGTPAPEAVPVAEVADEGPTASGQPVEEAPAPSPCPLCGAPQGGQPYCSDCGYIFPEDPALTASENGGNATAPPARLHGRYELGPRIGERGGITRHHGLDYGDGTSGPVPVVIIRAPVPELAAEVLPAEEAVVPEVEPAGEEILPTFEAPPVVPAAVAADGAASPWPSVAWERELLQKLRHLAVPAFLDTFTEGGFEYLVEELPTGRPLWDAWDDPAASADQRFGWLQQIADGLHWLHKHGAMLEGLRPDVVVVTGQGTAMLTDLSDLLPLPPPPGAPVRGTLYTAPELAAANDQVDARADLYSFGATLYALHVGRELTETDFDKQGAPKPFIPHFPDSHPLFARLITKTFCRDPHGRFPTDEAAREDLTGFLELIRTLGACRRVLGNARLDLAAWTTTGMVRTGNEDAFALLHAAEARQDDLNEYALVLLADGMGGSEAGEVAAGLAIHHLRDYLVKQRMFAALGGQAPPEPSAFSVETGKQAILAALRHANQQVYAASRSGIGRRGMGCTAEAVYADGRNLIVGHVGDSRTYHYHAGRLVQVTRDQTLVNRLIELGQLTEEEAEAHPRRSELQQAVGGRPDVEPELYHTELHPGDWVVICSDGLTNHVKAEELKEMLQTEAVSAEMAARRLVNFVNLRGANDNATVVVIRAT